MLSIHYKKSILTSLFLVIAGIFSSMHIWKISPALPLLKNELKLDLVDAGFLLSSVQIAGMTLGLITGLFAERIGLRRCIAIGLIILTTASLSVVLFPYKNALLLSRTIEGCGFLMVVLPVPALIRQIVPKEAISQIFGFWGCYMSLGAVVILLGGSWLLSIGYSWRTLWLILSGLTFIVLLLFLKITHEKDQNTSSEANSSLSISYNVISTLRSSQVWLVALLFSAYAAQWTAIIGFLPIIYADMGISGLAVGSLTALVAGVNIIGNLYAGRLLHKKVDAKKLLIVGFFTMAITTFIAFGLKTNIAIQFVSILLFSIAGGVIPVTLYLLAVIFAPTPQTTASTIGWVQQGSSMGQFLGAPVVAWSVSMLGGWQWAWVATVIFSLLGISMVTLLPKPIN
ncbi:CynX/NimT family MFS transporter [Paenalcaligenes hominis]|nr:MFS transporter [Paenalcaligenes hominis]